MKYTIKTTSASVKAFDGEKQIGSILFETVHDDDNDRMLSLIESADVDEDYQHQGIYTAMLIAFAEKNFKDNQYFCSIGRSFEAGNFWAKKLGISLDETEAEIEKDQQERALIIDFELDLINNEYSNDLFELFW